MLRSLFKVIFGIVLMIVSAVAAALQPLIDIEGRATVADLLVQSIPSILFLAALILCVVGTIQFIYRTLRKTYAVGQSALARSDGH